MDMHTHGHSDVGAQSLRALAQFSEALLLDKREPFEVLPQAAH